MSDILNFRMYHQAEHLSIIRQRGQLTIPDSVRGQARWVAPGSAVIVSRVKPDEIVIRPYRVPVGEADWGRLWRNIELSRSYKGKYKGSLSRFIIEDREKRR